MDAVSGMRANRRLIEALRTELVSSASNVPRSQMSLDGQQAKVWIDEEENGVKRHLVNAPPESTMHRGGSTATLAPD